MQYVHGHQHQQQHRHRQPTRDMNKAVNLLQLWRTYGNWRQPCERYQRRYNIATTTQWKTPVLRCFRTVSRYPSAAYGILKLARKWMHVLEPTSKTTHLTMRGLRRALVRKLHTCDAQMYLHSSNIRDNSALRYMYCRQPLRRTKYTVLDVAII